MKREIKIPYALKNDEWVHVSQVESGLKSNCICPCCKNFLVARKGTKVKHHFAHHDSTNCQPETVLHFVAKTFLVEKIQKHLASRTPLAMTWPCEKCGKIHEANLLRKATQVRLEYRLDSCKPDVLLLAAEDKPVAAIEIIVTHKPEDSAKMYYRQRGIALIEIEVSDGEALEMIKRDETLLATRIDQCTSAKCKQCGSPLKENQLVVFAAPCRRCKCEMKMCFIFVAESYFRGPKEFTSHQIQIAKEHGVCLEQKFSQTMGEEYLANVCPTCKKWVGEHYLPSLANEVGAASEKFVVGYHCVECSRDW